MTDLKGDMENDENFGIVVLEILSGRKDYDRDYMTPGTIDERALPLIRLGRVRQLHAIIDRNMAFPKNVELLLKLANIIELTLKENPSERPLMSNLNLVGSDCQEWIDLPILSFSWSVSSRTHSPPENLGSI